MGLINVDEIIYIDGEPHRRITGSYSDDRMEEWRVAQWIEGIGATYGLSQYHGCFNYLLLSPDMQVPFFMLAHVRENGKTIFDQTDVLKSLGLDVPTADVSGADLIEAESKHIHQCYDMQGRPMSHPRHGELFIRDGKIQFNR